MSQANPNEVQLNAYCENYVLYGDQSRAFRAAFPESKGKPESINQRASNLNKLIKVQSRVKEINISLSDQTKKEFNTTIEDLKNYLIEAVEGGLKEKLDPQGNKVPHSIPGAVSAIAELNRMDGNHAPTKQDHSSSDGTMASKSYSKAQYEKAQESLSSELTDLD